MLLEARMVRFATFSQHGTFSALKIQNIPICWCLEPYSRDNVTNISSVPANTYLCKRVWSPKYQVETFELQDVQGRSYVRFHPGNRDNDTQACILTGSELGVIGGDYAILESKKAFARFMETLSGVNEFYLTIVESY